MKQFVFFCFVSMLCLFPVMSIQGEEDPMRMVEAERIRHEGVWELHMKVRGRSDFTIVRGNQEKEYVANEAKTFGDDYLFFGYLIHREPANWHLNGFVLIADAEGEVIFEKEVDLGEEEEVWHVERFADSFVLHIRQTREGGHIHLADSFLVYADGRLRGTHSRDDPFIRVDKHQEILYLSDRAQGEYQKAFCPERGFLDADDVLVLTKDGVYETGVTFHFLRKAVHEGETVIGPLHFDYPGHHSLLYQGETYHFTVHPRIEGVSPHEILEAPLSLAIDAGQPFLNNDAYASGEMIQEPGYYILEVKGLNDYVQEVPFTLTSGITNIESHTVYEDPLFLSFSGEGRLNGKSVASGTMLSDGGVYTLAITGTNGYEESYHFELDLDDERSGNDFLKLELVLVGVTAIAVGFLLYRLVKKT